jgi:hypothetical protein
MLQSKPNKSTKPRGKEMVSFFFSSFPLSVMLHEGFQHINCLIILNYKNIKEVFYYRQAERLEEQCVCDT